MGKDELLALGNELRIELTEADLTKPAAEELSDDEPDAVAGGSDVSRALYPHGALVHYRALQLPL